MDIDNLTPREVSLYTKLALAENGFLLRDVAVNKNGNIFRKTTDNLLISDGMLTKDGHDLLGELIEKMRERSDERD